MPADYTNDLESAYLAGMIDADGCINLYPNRGNYQIWVEVCQSSRKHLEELQTIWGGRIQEGTRGSHLIWSNKADAQRILEAILNYTKFKLDQAGIVLMYITDVARGSGKPLNKTLADALHHQLKLLRKEHYALRS